MKTLRRVGLAILSILSVPLQAQMQSDEWTLVWSDEFNEDGRLNPDSWKYEEGFVRNNEAQWYQPDNAYCKDGCLVIEARKVKGKRQNPRYDASSGHWPMNVKSID